MKQPFRLGVSPDFYTEAREQPRSVSSPPVRGLADIEVAPMPPAVDLMATPKRSISSTRSSRCALRVTRDSL